MAKLAKIVFDFSHRPPIVMLNGESVGHLLRAGDATRAASFVAQVPAIREQLVRQQQEIAAQRPNLVSEGRDQGTIVFPHAALKFYLDATSAERRRRRADQLRAAGRSSISSELQRQIVDRDTRHAHRQVGPLAIPPDAAVIDTTNLSEAKVIEQIVASARTLQKR